MRIKSQKRVWESLAETDPLWSILTTNEKLGGMWDIEEFFRTGTMEVQQLMKELEELNIHCGKDAVLDFGCGVGRVTQAFCKYFDRTDGIDISSRMISLAEQLNRFPDRCRYAVNDTSDIRQFASDSFDLVYSNIVLQHVAPSIAIQYMKEFVRVTKHGGLMIFQIPYWLHWRRRIQWRRRIFEALQGFGIKGHSLIKRGFNPMRMAFLPRQKVETILTSTNCTILNVKSWSNENVGSCRYIARKRMD
ncbi:MAG TPA: class I SAM-dependent methyltransferase [Bacteroidota bacterium]|nr:class I SAM-dependent methyltransferase [Bacteroidota bacterium]